MRVALRVAAALVDHLGVGVLAAGTCPACVLDQVLPRSPPGSLEEDAEGVLRPLQVFWVDVVAVDDDRHGGTFGATLDDDGLVQVVSHDTLEVGTQGLGQVIERNSCSCGRAESGPLR